MPASLTPLHRFAPHLHTVPRAGDEASAVDLPIPLPPPTVTTPWPPRRGGASFVPALDQLEAAVAAMDAGDRTQPPARRLLDQARAKGYDEGLRAGAVERSWWDVFVGMVWGLVLGAAAAWLVAWLGWVSMPGTAGPVAAPVNVPVPTQRQGSTVALTMLGMAAAQRRRPATWWVEAPHRACDACGSGVLVAGRRHCQHHEVVRYGSGQPVPVSEARAADGLCGTDARHHTLA